ncbi:uncharacterized protein LOC115633012 [Scaptodrosophila lebanonensis]|uniref:Uncharacterized protein LOC115633012 n=1 Tax=Drosophila lebanonensis TaxID=7225 RepID=A0A6J2UGF6_DROLE|nr:uncharacterized protein LOC115633012 [Scaptodrosophila lebanonensis]
MARLLIALLITLPTLFGIGKTTSNLTEFLQHRQKRWLIFENRGSIKFAVGPSMPIPLGDKVSWRSLVLSYNLHGFQHNLPTEPTWPWDKWETLFARSMQAMRRNIERRTASGAVRYPDDARELVYTAFEEYTTRRAGGNDPNLGRQCLLRSICENAQIHQHVGVFSELLNIVLSPGKADLDASYHDAYEAGKSGANCLRLFKACPRGANILDEYLIVEAD